MAETENQRRVAVLLLRAVGPDGFALAGANAIREHGLTDRPTHDVDLFAFSTLTPEQFADAVDRAAQSLRDHGYAVSRVRSSALFVRLYVHDNDVDGGLEVDFGINWRARPPSESALGPILSEPDAVAGKLSAVYSRCEVRDFLDLDAIRASGRYSDAQLLALGIAESNSQYLWMKIF